jgi:hypothetical protein
LTAMRSDPFRRRRGAAGATPAFLDTLRILHGGPRADLFVGVRARAFSGTKRKRACVLRRDVFVRGHRGGTFREAVHVQIVKTRRVC